MKGDLCVCACVRVCVCACVCVCVCITKHFYSLEEHINCSEPDKSQ